MLNHEHYSGLLQLIAEIQRWLITKLHLAHAFTNLRSTFGPGTGFSAVSWNYRCAHEGEVLDINRHYAEDSAI